MSRRDVIGIPRGTRLLAVVRHEGEGWALWTATPNTSLPYSKWLGTYLFAADDGSVTRVTRRGEGYDDIMDIKPKED